MVYDDSNIYAKILRGDVKRNTIFKSVHAHAFAPLVPQADVHVVVACTGPYVSVVDFSARASQAELAGFWQSMKAVAEDLGLPEGELRLRIDAADAAEAPHFHVHLLSGKERPRGPLPDPLELVVILIPTLAEPTHEQIRALAAALDLERVDARHWLSSQVPAILAKGQSELVQPLVRTLHGQGVSLGCVGSAELIRRLEPWPVTRVEIEETGFFVVGPEGRRALVLDREVLLVRGRYAAASKPKKTSTGAFRRRITGSFSRLPPDPRFVHLYLRGDPRPISFVDSQISDYAFLREDMLPSARANYEALIDILADRPEVTVNETLLETDPATAQRAVSKLWTELERPSDDRNLDTEVLSRLIYYSIF